MSLRPACDLVPVCLSGARCYIHLYFLKHSKGFDIYNKIAILTSILDEGENFIESLCHVTLSTPV